MRVNILRNMYITQVYYRTISDYVNNRKFFWGEQGLGHEDSSEKPGCLRLTLNSAQHADDLGAEPGRSRTARCCQAHMIAIYLINQVLS